MPMVIPAARAASCAAATCEETSHCTQTWNSVRDASAPRSTATSADRGSRSQCGQARKSGPYISAIAHHAAQSSSARPDRTRNESRDACRDGLSGTRLITSSAARLAAQTASLSSRAAVPLAARRVRPGQSPALVPKY